MEFVLVFDHLRSLPVVLDAGSLEGELFHFDRYRAASLCFNDCDIVFGLNVIEFDWKSKKRSKR